MPVRLARLAWGLAHRFWVCAALYLRNSTFKAFSKRRAAASSWAEGQYRGHILRPGLCGHGRVALGEQLQLQHAALAMVLRWRGDVGGHFQAQQGLRRIAFARGAAGLAPSRARSGGRFAQISGRGQGGCVALRPGLQQLRYGFARALGLPVCAGPAGQHPPHRAAREGCV